MTRLCSGVVEFFPERDQSFYRDYLERHYGLSKAQSLAALNKSKNPPVFEKSKAHYNLRSSLNEPLTSVKCLNRTLPLEQTHVSGDTAKDDCLVPKAEPTSNRCNCCNGTYGLEFSRELIAVEKKRIKDMRFSFGLSCPALASLMNVSHAIVGKIFEENHLESKVQEDPEVVGKNDGVALKSLDTKTLDDGVEIWMVKLAEAVIGTGVESGDVAMKAAMKKYLYSFTLENIQKVLDKFGIMDKRFLSITNETSVSCSVERIPAQVHFQQSQGDFIEVERLVFEPQRFYAVSCDQKIVSFVDKDIGKCQCRQSSLKVYCSY